MAEQKDRKDDEVTEWEAGKEGADEVIHCIAREDDFKFGRRKGGKDVKGQRVRSIQGMQMAEDARYSGLDGGYEVRGQQLKMKEGG